MNPTYLKTLMLEAGILKDPSPGTTWNVPEEQAWKTTCGMIGARYTAYPERAGQDPDLLDKIDREVLVLQGQRPVQQSVVDMKQLLPMPVRLQEGAPTQHARVFRTLGQIPERLRVARPLVDPLAGLEPNINAPVTPKRRTARMDPEKARRLNEARNETVTPNSTSTTLRVR